MKRDIIGDIFLGGVLLSLLFLFSFPVYFAYTGIQVRPIELNERLMSVCFLMALVLTTIWACWKKKVWVIVGLATFGVMAYLPKWFLPMVEDHITKNGSDFMYSSLSALLNRIYELVHAPFAGSIGLIGEKQAQHLPEKILPVCVISYILANIFRYYKNAFVAERKQKKDFAHFRRNTEARKAVQGVTDGVREAPMPLGTVVMNEKAEIEQEVYTGRETTLVDDATVETKKLSVDAKTAEVPVISAAEEETRRIGTEPRTPAIETNEEETRRIGMAALSTTEENAEAEAGEETKVIELAAHAPTSQVEETKVIELAAHAPTSQTETEETKVIELAAHAPTSQVEETKVIELAEHAPTSRVDETVEAEPGEQSPETGAENASGEPVRDETALDFPDVRGEAEKIDVFADIKDLD